MRAIDLCSLGALVLGSAVVLGTGYAWFRKGKVLGNPEPQIRENPAASVAVVLLALVTLASMVWYVSYLL